jgi:hypothetical protein
MDGSNAAKDLEALSKLVVVERLLGVAKAHVERALVLVSRAFALLLVFLGQAVVYVNL